MQASSSQQTQSLLARLFDERIEKAKKDYDDAAQKLADFSREHKIYSSDDPIKQNPNIASDEMGTYLQLKSDAEIKRTIYTNLIQQYEQNKVQEAMESMDIQVIDVANLPDENKPSAPRKKLIISLSFVIGGLLSIAFLLYRYRIDK